METMMTEDAQCFLLEVGIANANTMMMTEPLGFVGVDGEVVAKDDALVFGTDYLEEIGLVMMQCLSQNGGTMGAKYFKPILTEDPE